MATARSGVAATANVCRSWGNAATMRIIWKVASRLPVARCDCRKTCPELLRQYLRLPRVGPRREC